MTDAAFAWAIMVARFVTAVAVCTIVVDRWLLARAIGNRDGLQFMRRIVIIWGCSIVVRSLYYGLVAFDLLDGYFDWIGDSSKRLGVSFVVIGLEAAAALWSAWIYWRHR